MSDFDPRPIGVFDSGIGGLTVLQTLTAEFRDENFFYLGDSARLPYGNKSPARIRQFTEQALTYLQIQNCKALVIACNSASSQFPETDFASLPVYTVIKPGALSALELSAGNIGVLGTRATIQSGIYTQALNTLAEKQGKKITITAVAAPLFVPLAEEGWVDDPVTNLIVYRYTQPLKQADVDTVILGCTHYPILRNSIQKVLGNHVQLIDSGKALCSIIKDDFANHKLNPAQQREFIKITTTDRTDLFEHFSLQLIPKASSISLVQIDESK